MILIEVCALALFLLGSGNLVSHAPASNNPGAASERMGLHRRSALAPLLLTTGHPAPGPELQVSVRYSELPVGEQQEFWLKITQEGAPVAGVRAQLTLILPDYIELNLFPLTSATGETYLQIAPLAVEPGRLIRYSVCLPQGEENYCRWDEFILIDNKE